MINKAILVGRLTADPELKQTPNGVSICTFSIAVNRPYSGKGGEKQTDFITIVTWRSTAEYVAKYFRKGNAIGVDGSIQTRSYTDKQGNKRTSFEVVAEQVSFVEGKQLAGTSEKPLQANTATSQSGFEEISIDEDDDLPF